MKNDRSHRTNDERIQHPSGLAEKPSPGGAVGRFDGLTEIFLLFLVSRATLTVIGVLALSLIGRQTGGRIEWEHPSYRWLDVWGQWDTGWYLDIAKTWYSAELHYKNLSNYAFFPLYPTLIKLLGTLIGNYFVVGLIISNAALLGTAVLLYKFVLLDNDREVAMNSVKYLFLWPSSFVLSGVLSEGLFLLLLIAGFYQIRKQAWPKAALAGFFMTLTRVIGICFSLPLLYEYMLARKFSLRAIRPDLLALALVPAGLALFSVYNYYLTGDFLAFVHLQSAWGRQPGNPLTTLLYGMAGIGTNINDMVSAWFTGVSLAALAIFYKKIPVSHLLFCACAIFIPLSSGLISMPRFLAVLFPLFVLCGQLGRNRKTDLALTTGFAVLQGFFMVFWSIGSYLII